jgi:hypothetical protein
VLQSCLLQNKRLVLSLWLATLLLQARLAKLDIVRFGKRCLLYQKWLGKN